ncbi:MAG TPA: tRNA lysidine(34) synthetase TilS, partial [Bacteroidota bacterium]|nr:tRNA lysidine(34) synthetase TilS [Bacteroidota bacterium]
RSLVIRSWRDGDWFVPLGMRGRKKLSDFFGDEKISVREKNRIPILESDDRIVWVCGRRLDDRFKITQETRRAIKLTYSPTTSPATE